MNFLKFHLYFSGLFYVKENKEDHIYQGNSQDHYQAYHSCGEGYSKTTYLHYYQKKHENHWRRNHDADVNIHECLRGFCAFFFFKIIFKQKTFCSLVEEFRQVPSCAYRRCYSV